ncbi:50S ribosomal protein L11 methyltransferase [Peptostreptococcus faecalis]|uniref:50S ribosomal protein L11 methyltransferase n=1 Tax=Peptostreptococcus faecalis TaxID=2045015 RepID=UPI000C7BF2A2|nr:50S ribosomal protein L11 methyltransferase [Peptostreptococcus faecalis]
MNESWIEVSIKTTTEAVEAITNILFENGAQGAMIDDPKDFMFQKAHEYDWDYVEEDMYRRSDEAVVIKTYIPEEKNVSEFISIISEKIKNLSSFGLDIGEGEVTTNSVKEDDWANNWKQYYKTFKIGDRIVIKPQWEEYSSKDNEIVIEMDPGMAFGTGSHETTSMCIENIEKYINNDSLVIDIGTGSGILGIIAAKLGAKEVIGIDIDELAVKVAKQNILNNNVDEKMSVVCGNLADDIDKNKKADIVVANIMADIVIFLSDSVKSFLKEDGVFITSGIILDKIDEVSSALEKNGFTIVDIQKKGEWSCIVAK